ncbi:AtpZ/AtpI family protein [Evansella halocellulosilytica]|uniref:AtpZ/AtpI family protein n=1 Tax=Evansella halocellulosilytica TaxID=2011013 RepID=UPI000BB94375|nr:AtpZ/AtpI family protein [Evansella halocellulosilytica]
MPEQPSKIRQTMKALTIMTTLSSYVIGSIVIGLLGGRWVDERLHGNGLFLIIGLVLGIGAAVSGIFIVIRQFLREESS